MTKIIPWPDSAERREVHFQPAFHRCTDPKGNFGIGSVTMLWVLRVDGWAMTWDTFTAWGLPDEQFRSQAPTCEHPRHLNGYPRNDASGGAVDWHSPVPLYEDHQPMTEDCPWLGGRCYLDSGFCLGSDLFDLLRVEGGEAVWTKLRALLDEQRLQVASR